VRSEDLAALPPASDAEAPDPPELYPNLQRRFGLDVGVGYLANFDSTVRVDSGILVGGILDLEDFLGVAEDNTVLRLDAYWRFSPRHSVTLSYYDIKRDGLRTINEDIVVGEVTIPASEVETTFSTLIAKASYRYDFVTDYRTRIGASFGLHTMDIDLGLSSAEFDVQEDFDVTAPLPVVGLQGEYALSERWKLRASVEFLQVDLGPLRGFLSDTRLAVEHDLFDHFGWGVGFNGFKLYAKLDDDPLSADIEYGYQGLFLYLRAYL
jgi:hypothetical protein